MLLLPSPRAAFASAAAAISPGSLCLCCCCHLPGQRLPLLLLSDQDAESLTTRWFFARSEVNCLLLERSISEFNVSERVWGWGWGVSCRQQQMKRNVIQT
jgi:hypothetical protein